MRSLLIFLLTAFWSSAQQSTVSAGNSNTVTGTEISFSIGITFYVDQSNSGLMIESGVQHAYQATVGTSGVIDTHVGVWPNPVQDALHLTTPVSMNIFSTQGELVYSGKTNIVDMSVFDAGIYLVSIKNKVVKIVKI